MKKFIKSISLALILIIGITILSACDFEKEKGPAIKIHTAFKTEYFKGEALNVTGGILDYIDEDGNKTPVVIKTDMIDGFDSSEIGTKEMVITYNSCSKLISYTVKANEDWQVGKVYKATMNMEKELFVYIGNAGTNLVFASNNQIGEEPSGWSAGSTLKSKTLVNGYYEVVVEFATTPVVSYVFTKITENSFKMDMKQGETVVMGNLIFEITNLQYNPS